GIGKVNNTLFSNQPKGIYILEREDNNEKEVVKDIAHIIAKFSATPAEEISKLREQAHQLSEVFSWEKQFTHYEAAYSLALQKSLKRKILYQDKPQVHPIVLKEEIETKPNWRHIVIKEELPEMLKGL